MPTTLEHELRRQALELAQKDRRPEETDADVTQRAHTYLVFLKQEAQSAASTPRGTGKRKGYFAAR